MYNPQPDTVTITLPIGAWSLLDGMAAAFGFEDATGNGKVAAFTRAYEQSSYEARRRSPDTPTLRITRVFTPEPLPEDYEPVPIPKVVDVMLPASAYHTLAAMAEQVGYRDETGNGDIAAFLLCIQNGEVEVVHRSGPPSSQHLHIYSGSPG